MPVAIPPIGAPKSEIDTPALLINHEVLDRNIQKMAGYFAGSGVRLRSAGAWPVRVRVCQ